MQSGVQTLGESGQAEREAVIKYGVESFSIQKKSFSRFITHLKFQSQKSVNQKQEKTSIRSIRSIGQSVNRACFEVIQ